MGDLTVSSDQPIPIDSSQKTTNAQPLEIALGDVKLSLDEMSIAVNGDKNAAPPTLPDITENNFSDSKILNTFQNWQDDLVAKINILENNFKQYKDKENLITSLYQLTKNPLTTPEDFINFKNQLNNSHGVLFETFFKNLQKEIGPSSDYDTNDTKLNSWLTTLRNSNKPPGPVETIPSTFIPPSAPKKEITDDYLSSIHDFLPQSWNEIQLTINDLKKDFENYMTYDFGSNEIDEASGALLVDNNKLQYQLNKFISLANGFNDTLTNRSNQDISSLLNNNGIFFDKSDSPVGYDLSPLNALVIYANNIKGESTSLSENYTHFKNVLGPAYTSIGNEFDNQFKNGKDIFDKIFP